MEVILDNANLRFDDLENGAWIIDLNQDGKLEGRWNSAEYFRLKEPVNINGQVWEVASLSPDGTKLILQPSTAKVPMRSYLKPGCPAMAFLGNTLDGRTVDLKAEAAKSKYVLLDFWASWWLACRDEFPTRQRLWRRYKNHGLQIIGVNLDSHRELALEAVHDAKLEWPHIF